MTKFVRLCRGLNTKGDLVPHDEIYNKIDDANQDWYRGLYYFTEIHHNRFYEELPDASGIRGCGGITDVVTDQLVFDFDDKDDIENAKSDTLELIGRLYGHGITSDYFDLFFSGSKGFSVELSLSREYDPKTLKGIAKGLTEGLKTWDSKVYNPTRLFRIPTTRNQNSGLFKIAISVDQFSDLSIDEIRALAEDTNNSQQYGGKPKVQIPVDLIPKEDKKERVNLNPLPEFRREIKWLPACKEAILKGFFKAGNRSHSLMALGAACKAHGLPKEIVYRMLKGAAELQAKRTGASAFDKDEIWNNIISVLYGPNWNGATYACKDHEFLQELCKEVGHQCKPKKESIVPITAVSNDFLKYATEIDKNTVKTGIPSIDRNIRLQTHSHVVLAACSGSGKTNFVLNLLKNASHNGVHSVFASLDMGGPLVFQRLAQKVTNLGENELYKIYQNGDTQKIRAINDLIMDDYKNTLFDFRSGITIEELRENILQAKEKHGDNLKLVVVDFINRLRGPYGDDLANLNHIAPRLSDLSNETETLIVSLAQISRAKGGPSTPLLDSRVAKGSSAIEESATVLFGLWREGYNTDKDKFMTIAALKTRMGKEFKADLRWDGLTGNISELDDFERQELEQLRDSKKQEKSSNDSWS